MGKWIEDFYQWWLGYPKTYYHLDDAEEFKMQFEILKVLQSIDQKLSRISELLERLYYKDR